MSSPSPIPPPNDRRSSRASSSASLPLLTPDDVAAAPGELRMVGGPPNSPSPLALRASHSPSSKRPRSRIVKAAPDLQSLEYLSAPDSNLVCLICHTPFDKPVRLPCEHYFCRECLDHAWAPQPDGRKTCPTCRTKIDPERDLRPVPKIVENMLDELVVRCTNSRAGCDWVDHRINVHDHVMLYCDCTPVECSSQDCRLHIPQKDYHKGCLHYTVNCDDCHVSLMKKDLEEHQRTTCAQRSTTCTLCSAHVLRLHLKAHVNNDCPMHIISCQGAIVGCAFRQDRAAVLLHEKMCPMATMAPHFREQQARIERNEARMEPLARKVGILEDGLTNITNMLYPANPSDASYPVTDPLDANNTDMLAPATDFRLPPATFPPVTQGTDSTPAQPPFDSQVHHLLTLHDSLREEVSRITNAMTELEGRTNMMVFNESQRVKEDMLRTNSVISNMRMHMQWLMSSHLHNRSSSSSNSTGRTAGVTNGSASGGSVTQGSGARPGPSGMFQMPFRRLSDTTRQDTKL